MVTDANRTLSKPKLDAIKDYVRDKRNKMSEEERKGCNAFKRILRRHGRRQRRRSQEELMYLLAWADVSLLVSC